MRESYSFNVPKEHGGIPLSTAQDGAMDVTKHRIKLFAQDLSRMLKGEKSKFQWQLVGSDGKPVTALDAKPKQRLDKKMTQNKTHNTKPVTPIERQKQSQSDKAKLIDRLWSGAGTLEKKFWPD